MNDNEKQKFRDYKCLGYEKCLRTASLLDYPMADCATCPNRRHKKKKPTNILPEMIIEEAENCLRLIRAVLDPEWYQNQGTTKRKEPPLAETDRPLVDGYLDD